MTIARLFRFKFTAPLHIANVRAEYDRSESTLSSDTLYAAVMSAWATLGKKEWISGNPEFALSSLFPYYAEDKEALNVRYFLPKPAGVLKAKDSAKHKQLKKIRYLEADLFFNWARGNTIAVDANQQAGDFYLSKPVDEEKRKIIEGLIAKEVYPHVRVPRVEGKDAEPYYIERMWFAEGGGLYCLFVGSDEDCRKVKSALLFLQHEGLGTDRHVGNGLFELQESEPPSYFKLHSNNATHLVNLSLFCPESPEQLRQMLPEEDKHVAYELARRGGWITAEPFLTLRKRYIHMFGEGGIFANAISAGQMQNFAIAGATHNVRPEWNDSQLHDIYRSGRAIFVPVKLNMQS